MDDMDLYICYECIHVMYLYVYMHTAGGTHMAVEKLLCISMHIYEIYIYEIYVYEIYVYEMCVYEIYVYEICTYICDAFIHEKCIYTHIMYVSTICIERYLCVLRERERERERAVRDAAVCIHIMHV